MSIHDHSDELGAEKQRHGANKLRSNELILIAEDHLINQKVAQLFLEELGFASHTVNDGSEALKALAEKEYSLILMDCQMPVMDGYTACEMIRKEELITGNHIPIIAMTAHAMKSDRDHCFAVGMDDYLTKPMLLQPLATAIERALKNRKKRSTAPSGTANGDRSTLAPIDLDTIESRYGARAQTLFIQFLESGHNDLDKIQAAFTSLDLVAFKQAIHGYKGICGAICATKMRSTCVEIELSAETKWNDLPALLERLQDELLEAQEFISSQTNQVTK